jgi:hypothetical protein
MPPLPMSEVSERPMPAIWEAYSKESKLRAEVLGLAQAGDGSGPWPNTHDLYMVAPVATGNQAILN